MPLSFSIDSLVGRAAAAEKGPEPLPSTSAGPKDAAADADLK